MSLYIPNLSTDEFGPFVQGLADNFGALEGSLVEYGENENGEYWCWENGLQICATTVTKDLSNWTFPPAFPSPKSFVGHFAGAVTRVSPTITNIAQMRALGSLVISRSSAMTFSIGVGQPTENSFEVTLGVVLIGRWK